MTTCSADVLQGDEAILCGVMVAIHETRPARGAGEWCGEFDVPEGSSFGTTAIEARDPYTIVLSDGRKGKMFVTNLTLQSSATAHVVFQGTGPLE